MSFTAGWAFAGFVLLAVLVALHLRRRGEVVREVPSLLLWDRVAPADAGGRRGLRRPALPLLLALQALALALLVLALAKPASAGHPAKHTEIIVLDDSWQMQAPGRIAEARREASQLLGGRQRGTRVSIVLAGAGPSVFFSGSARAAREALSHVRAGAAPADLASALTVAEGLSAGAHDSIVLIRAPEDPAPPAGSGADRLRTVTLAGPVSDQGIFDASATCGIGASAACEIRASVRNTSTRAVEDHVIAQAAGHPALTLPVNIGPDASAPVTLSSEPGQQVTLRLSGHDALSADDEAWVTVPAAGNLPVSSLVTLVGKPAVALATARAFAAVPGVTLHLRTTATFRPADARQSGLLVLDHMLPKTGLPASPAVLLIDPPRLPEGRVGGVIGEAVVSGTDGGSELLSGVELTSLSVDARAASRLTLPGWLAPVIWSPEGVLLAAGDDGRQRVAALAFEPGLSNLPQLSALPILAANLVRWAAGWAPASATAGVPFALDAGPGVSRVTLLRGATVLRRMRVGTAPLGLTVSSPGLYTVRETGRGLSRQAQIAINTSDTPAVGYQPVELGSLASAGGATPLNRADWFLAAALLALLAEWAYWVSRRGRLAL